MKPSSFLVHPGSKLRLARIDPSFTNRLPSREAALPLMQKHLARIAQLQYLLYADGTRSMLIVLQALDAGGKDGVIRHLFSGINPQGISVHGFKQPNNVEAAHDFLWRAHLAAPAKGEMAIFNRSHYEDVLVVRVHGLVKKALWSKRYEEINDFERTLARSGTRILKFYLHVSPEEQLERFRQRLEDPLRQWKISEADYTERERWPQYIEAYQDAIERTSTAYAPWYVIPANHKWFRDLAISRILADAMDDMKLALPPTRVDLAAIRRRYHQAQRQQRSTTRRESSA